MPKIGGANTIPNQSLQSRATSGYTSGRETKQVGKTKRRANQRLQRGHWEPTGLQEDTLALGGDRNDLETYNFKIVIMNISTMTIKVLI